jgi:hypothetical protein
MSLSHFNHPLRNGSRLLAILAAWLAMLLAAPGRPAAQALNFLDDPLVNALHLYVVDISNLSDQHIPAVQAYVASRWAIFGGATRRAQRGVLVLMNGVHGLNARSAPLPADDRTHVDFVRTEIIHARERANPRARPGLELNETAGIIREHVRQQIDAEINTLVREKRSGGLLIVVHLIASSFKYTPSQGNGMVSLEQNQYPDSCFGNGILLEDIRRFPERIRELLGDANGAALRGLLVFVPTSNSRHVPTAERAIALRIFGDALLDGSARAMHDGLDCLELDADIDVTRRDHSPCASGRELPPRPPSPRPPGSCLSISAPGGGTERILLMRRRVATTVQSLATGTNIILTSTAQSVLQQHPRQSPATPPTSAPVTPPTLPPPPPQASTPSTPPPSTNTIAVVPTSAPIVTSPTPPVPAKPIAIPQPPMPPPTAAPTPPAQPQQTGSLPPAQQTPPDATPARPQRITAITSKAALPPGVHPTMNVNGRLDGVAGSVTVHLLPRGHALGAVMPGDRFDITRGTTALLPSGQYSVVARVAQAAGCQTGGQVAFKFALYGWRVGREAAEFSVSLANTCQASERVVPLATLELQ